MTASRDIRMLVRYAQWAGSRLFSVLEPLPASELVAPRAAGPGNLLSMLGTLAHCHRVDLIWKGHLEGRPHGFSSRIPDRLPPLDELRANQAEVDTWYVAYADSLTEPMQQQVLRFDFVDGSSGSMSRGDMLLHVVNHKTYHRGYVAQMLYQAGAKPPVMDLPVFLRDTEPRV